MILHNIERFTLFVTKMKLHHVSNNTLNMFIQAGNMIKTVMSDKGTEYTDQAFVEIAKKNGIEIGRSAIYAPQQNRRTERENRTLIEISRTMLLTHGMCLDAFGQRH